MPAQFDLLCFSHLRWDFVYQRPQHLLSRAARERRVFYVEEPVSEDGPARLALTEPKPGLVVAVPHLPATLPREEHDRVQRELLEDLLRREEVHEYALWYYTPMALGFTGHLRPRAIVYDCMDELSLFRGASPALAERETELFGRADLVFTGGHSLYEAKRDRHPSVHPFPSSVDTTHFRRARARLPEPADQAGIPGPRLGFFGVIDERMDLDLLAALADARPEWQLVLIGPVVKIDPATLPRRANIHYLGGRTYPELPSYLAGWDVALLPFALNDSTRFISPTKTPEYLAAAKPVVSTPIRDVVRPYGENGLVQIADTPAAFVSAVERALLGTDPRWLQQVDAFLAGTSWDTTWARIAHLLAAAIERATAPVSAAAVQADPALIAPPAA